MQASKDHELTFCAEAAAWMNQVLALNPDLAFEKVKIEQSARKSAKRRDLTIYDRSGKVAITGEVKLPYMADGASPYADRVVDDAFTKAARIGAQYFVTWNVNRLVLWQTNDRTKPLLERNIYEVAITQVRDAGDLENPTVQESIKRGLSEFLSRASKAFKGEAPLTHRPLDQFFISILEAGLDRPILVTLHALVKKYEAGGAFRSELDIWMRDIQGWHLSDDELIRRDNLERAAKFSCFVLVNKIVFYNKKWNKKDNIQMLLLLL